MPEPNPSGLELPRQSDRIANYTIQAELDPNAKTIRGLEVLTWRNTSTVPLTEFYFHLYLNAFRNNRSTYYLENSRNIRNRRNPGEQDWGFCRIESIQVQPDALFQATDVTPTLAFVQPDDDNRDDQTVFRIATPKPLPPGATLQLKIQFTSKLPRALDRSGYTGEFYFVAQWFPKMGVFWNGQWSCHQFHANSEFFADFGVYDVSITVPDRFVVGATGREVARQTAAGKTAYQFRQEDVHDFAWTASPVFQLRRRVFQHPGLRDVSVQLLLQPEHLSQAERHFQAVFNGLRYFGEWYGEYPYETLTVVDPAFGSTVGGMEYPTLITAGTHWWAPDSVLSPEGVTVHEFGHQFWYGLVANNEFEEAWLDEGFNTYSTGKVLQLAYGANHFLQRYGGGVPVVLREISFGRQHLDRAELRARGSIDSMARRAWEYHNTYGVNSYSKPALVLFTLENILGETTMARVMRTYHHRWRFKHPTTNDFIAVVNEVSGQDMTAFFEQTFFSSGLVDYAVESISNRDEAKREGSFDAATAGNQAKQGLEMSPIEGAAERQKYYYSEVVVRRLAEARLPVEVLVRFEDGSEKHETWDGQYTWKKYGYRSAYKVVEAAVDPDHKLALDVNPTNNTRQADPDTSWAARKWASRWLFWFQHLLEVLASIS